VKVCPLGAASIALAISTATVPMPVRGRQQAVRSIPNRAIFQCSVSEKT